ncbi:MAG: response regulator transcription factor [Oscillospiraceae bacterium]|nr:response regulator transcription factor [Oscillospiraceae bacterium]
MTNKTNILICDDDREIATAIGVYLKNEGYETHFAHDGHEALEILEKIDIQLIILDIMMPKLDGIKASMEIRKNSNVPIVFLSAKSEDVDKIMGLSVGADDYVTKPFNPLELVARVKSQLRRYMLLGSAIPASEQSGVYTAGELMVDDNNKSVSVDGVEVKLTPIEYKITLLLIRNLGRVFSIDEIYQRVWGEDAYEAQNTVAVHIRRIREKIEIDPKNPKYIKVVWGIGYKIDKVKRLD